MGDTTVAPGLWDRNTRVERTPQRCSAGAGWSLELRQVIACGAEVAGPVAADARGVVSALPGAVNACVPHGT